MQKTEYINVAEKVSEDFYKNVVVQNTTSIAIENTPPSITDEQSRGDSNLESLDSPEVFSSPENPVSNTDNSVSSKKEWLIQVKHQNEQGIDLAMREIITGEVGLPYEAQPKFYNQWTVKTTSSNASGTFTDQVQTVTYVYSKNKANPVNPEQKPDSNDKNNNQVTI